MIHHIRFRSPPLHSSIQYTICILHHVHITYMQMSIEIYDSVSSFVFKVTHLRQTLDSENYF